MSNQTNLTDYYLVGENISGELVVFHLKLRSYANDGRMRAEGMIPCMHHSTILNAHQVAVLRDTPQGALERYRKAQIDRLVALKNALARQEKHIDSLPGLASSLKTELAVREA